MAKKRRNVQDATLKNTRVVTARLVRLEARVKRLEAAAYLESPQKRTDKPKDRPRAK